MEHRLRRIAKIEELAEKGGAGGIGREWTRTLYRLVTSGWLTVAQRTIAVLQGAADANQHDGGHQDLERGKQMDTVR